MPSEKILIVDDDPIHLKLTRILLAAKGFDVETAEAAQLAIEALKTFAASLIITDFQLPDFDGLELVRRLKANRETRDIPVVLMTGGAHGADEGAAREAGCIGFIRKPIRADKFAEQVESFITTGDSGGLVLVVNDDAVERRILLEHLVKAGFKVATANDGVDGLEQARQLSPAVVVGDILMPRIDGFKMCEALRKDKDLMNTPVVLTTSGSIQKSDELMARNIGASAFVLRTVDMKAVLDAVRTSLVQGAPNAFPVDAALLESLRRYFVEEGERQTLRLIEELSNGLNRNSLRRLSHRWAGVAGTFGYPKISEVARDLESLSQRNPLDEGQLRAVLVELSELFMEAVGRS